MTDPATIAGVAVGSKKMVWLGIGMVQAAKSFEWMRLWPLLLALIFLGGAYQSLLLEHRAIYRYIAAEFLARDFKIDLSYERTTKGHRYTWEDSVRDNVEYARYKETTRKSIRAIEKAIHESSRFSKQGDRLERRIQKCEEKLNSGVRQ